MPDQITLQVARYRPEEEAAPTFQEYDVPCPKDRVVPDGHLWELRDDRQWRTEIDVRHFPRRLRPGSRARGASAQLPRHSRPRRRDRRLHAKAYQGETLDHPQGPQTV